MSSYNLINHRDILYNILFVAIYFIFSFFFPSLILAGRSTALSEEIEAKKNEMEKLEKEQIENERERKILDEENSHHGDTNSPLEEASVKELEE
jgi:cell division protein FtsB